MHDGFEGDEALEAIRRPHPVTTLLLIMAAGAIGVALRYGLDGLITRGAGDDFPWSTMAINIVGAFVIGLVVTLISLDANPTLRPALTIGLLGGFTTFSALAIEAVTLAEDGLLMQTGAYVVGTNVLGIAAAFAGVVLGRSFQ
jgi:CrcB protein